MCEVPIIQYIAKTCLEAGARDVGEELAEARAERVHAVHGRQEGAEERVTLRGAEPVVEVDLGNGKKQPGYHFMRHSSCKTFSQCLN